MFIASIAETIAATSEISPTATAEKIRMEIFTSLMTVKNRIATIVNIAESTAVIY